jgi:hypothetical protein
MRRLLILIIGALVAVTVSVASAAASALPVGVVSRPLRLDSYSPGLLPETPAVDSGTRLADKTLYVATVQGTLSYYAAIDYLNPQTPFDAMCGTPLSAPLFSSAGGSGKVSNDAQFILAIPSVTTCAGVVTPRPWFGFQINDHGYWTHPSVLSTHRLTRPTATHAYQYALLGRGRRVGFRLADPDTRDDYGTLHITLRRALASDCVGNEYKAYGLSSRYACLKDAAHASAPRPASPGVVRPLSLDQAPISKVVRESDVPTSVDQEVSSGALTADRFAQIDAPTAVAARAQARALTSDGLTSAAISEFADAGGPALRSTAILFRSTSAARAGYRTEVALDAEQAPAGASTTAAAEPPPAPANTTFVTFTPTTPGSVGGIELISLVGRYVYGLRAVQAPDLVDAPAEQALLATVIARG